MKKVLLFLLVFSLSVSNAEDLNTPNIQELIVAIKKAPEEKRFVLMNAFKKELRALNASARRDAFRALQNSLQSQKSVKTEENMAANHLRVLEVEQVHVQLQNQQQMQNTNQVSDFSQYSVPTYPNPQEDFK